MDKYRIVRVYQNYPKRVIRRGITLEEGQAHCNSSESKSVTCTSVTGKQRTKELGPWSDELVIDSPFGFISPMPKLSPETIKEDISTTKEMVVANSDSNLVKDSTKLLEKGISYVKNLLRKINENYF